MPSNTWRRSNQNGDTDTLSINIINDHLGLDIQPSDIDRTHRIGNKNKTRTKGRAIIIKFTRYNTRKKVFMNKIKSKETNICYRKFDFITNDKAKRCKR